MQYRPNRSIYIKIIKKKNMKMKNMKIKMDEAFETLRSIIGNAMGSGGNAGNSGLRRPISECKACMNLRVLGISSEGIQGPE